jgi:hypothetical protein
LAESNPNKNQHWIPQCYQQPWCDPDTPSGQTPYVWCFVKDGSAAKRRAPKNIFYEKDLYTIPAADGSRDLRIEHGLAGLESDFVTIRDNFLAQHKPLDEINNLKLRAFVAAMSSRTPFHINHWQQQFKAPLEFMRAEYEYQRSKQREDPLWKNVKLPSAADSPAIQEIQQIAEGPRGQLLAGMMEVTFPIVAKMSLAVVRTDDDVGFISSDDPCVLFDGDAQHYPPLCRSPVLVSPNSELTLPVSPFQCILLNWKGFEGYHEIPVKLVDDLNRKTCFSCGEQFMVRRNAKRDAWFDPGTPTAP